MIETKKFYDYLVNNNVDFFAGVPDSLLANFCACVKENTKREKNIITANEGNAIAIASGYYISTGKPGVVYMQNSGEGNAVNPLLSLADQDVYKIPMLLIIGWRGEPGTKDEPQHKKQGKVTLDLLEVMGIEYIVATDDFEHQLSYCIDYMNEKSRSIALIVSKGLFSDYKISKSENNYSLKREEALEVLISSIDNDSFIVSTTGKTSREIFEIRERNNQPHSHDFLTVGSMGHTSSIALGMSIGTNKNVFCIDGDGSFLMHMGGLAVSAQYADTNFKYILINNGAHESVGGQPTICFDFDVQNAIKSFGFKNVYIAEKADEVKTYIEKLKAEKLSALIINVKQGSRDDLGRPTISPEDNKIAMMECFKEGN